LNVRVLVKLVEPKHALPVVLDGEAVEVGIVAGLDIVVGPDI
jgi:hypothetical protein